MPGSTNQLRAEGLKKLSEQELQDYRLDFYGTVLGFSDLTGQRPGHPDHYC